MPPEDEDRAERAAHQAESERQNVDDRCSEPREFECADCGAWRVFGRRCDCGSYRLRASHA